MVGGGGEGGTRSLIDVCRKSDRYFGTIRLFFLGQEEVRPGPPRCEPPRVGGICASSLFLFLLFPLLFLPLVFPFFFFLSRSSLSLRPCN